MATKLYANLGKGGTDGQAVNNTLLAGGGDNPLIIGGQSGWVFEADDRSPDGPADGHGFRRTLTGQAAYLRSEWTPTGQRNGCRVWVYIDGTNPSAHWNFIRIVNASEQAVANVYLRTNGSLRAYQGSDSISASQSPVITGTPGWYCIQLIANYTTQRLEFRVQDASGSQVHAWDSGAGGVTLGSEVGGFRVGDVVAGSYGIEQIRVGSRVVWGSIDEGWIPNNVDPFTEAPDPPPDTTPVSHYNTAEGLTPDTLAPVGSGTGTEGTKLSSRLGTGGTVTVSSTGIHGSRSYRVLAGDGQAAYVQWGLNSDSLAIRAYYSIPSTPSHTTQVMVIRNELEEPVGRLVLTQESTVLLQCSMGGVDTTQSLGGAVVYPAVLRLELWVDVAANTVRGAWGYEGGGREGNALIDTRDLSGRGLILAQFGKMHGTSWAADFLLDDLAANVRAEDHIGAYASSYTMLSTVAPDITGVEPGTEFTLEALSGTETWTQVVGPDHPVVELDQDGMTATGIAPYTLDGVTLQFDYGGDIQQVEVMPATKRILIGGNWYPVREEIFFSD